MLQQILMYIKGEKHCVQRKALSPEQTEHCRPRSVATHGDVRANLLLAKHTERATTEEISSVKYGEAFEVKHVN
jgi:hypothetical protein